MKPVRRLAPASLLGFLVSLALVSGATAQDAAPPTSEPLPSEAAPVHPPAPAGAILPSSEAPSPADASGPSGSAGEPPSAQAAGSETLSQPAPASPPAVEAATLPRDLSPWGMFQAADWVVKAVMIGLAFASVVTWTVWLVKSLQIAGARLAARRAMRRLMQIGDLRRAAENRAGRGDVVSSLMAAALEEVGQSADLVREGLVGGIKERVAAQLSSVETSAVRRMTRGTILVATIGATAPFVGLFGTVWGIMNSFIGISEAQTTNLAIVAPGIAEALLATALGLVAAIPAVVLYNVLARAIGGYRKALADASREVMRLASRDLDRWIASGQRQAAE